MDGIENIINVLRRTSPLVLIGWGLLLIALHKYQQNHQSEIVGKIVSYI
ncbi:MAG: hypothetical protein J7K73_03080 [Nanoarchaeota archaeon]|nr:hypothetical protein [Nanoarchaeota archaeon]